MMVKTNCFAYRNNGCEAECSARNPTKNGDIPCRYGKKCHAFKTLESYEDELMRINGTTDMQQIIAAYSAADPDKRRERWLAIVQKVKGEMK